MFQTPFERNILPKFASWFSDIVLQLKPDYLIPVERKGAHLLDSVLGLLRAEFATSIRARVLYKGAVYFSEPAEMSGKNILLLDDTTHSGRTLHQYRTALGILGDPVVKMIACVGAPVGASDQNRRTQDDIRCFLEPPEDLYQEYVWQIAEHVISRGMPPEVDHHVFTLTADVELPQLWSQILQRLSTEGDLDVYEQPSADGTVCGATLHWPKFLRERILSVEGLVRQEGVNKLRLFADFRRRCIWLLPMMYPKVEIPLGNARETLTIAHCQNVFDQWRNPHPDIGRFILDNARCDVISGEPAAEILHRAISLVCETEVVRRFAATIASPLSELGEVQIQCDRDSFDRLYGPRVASQLVAVINGRVLPAMPEKKNDLDRERGGRRANFPSYSKPEFAEHNPIDDASEVMARFLKARYLESNRDKDHRRDWETVGYSFSELSLLAPFSLEKRKPLLLSRCIDYGCSIANLVPFLKAAFDKERAIWTVDRRYRTSEIKRDKTNEDFRTYKLEIAAEIVAAIAYFLTRRSNRWLGKAVPMLVEDKILTILRQAMPNVNLAPLIVVPREHGPEIAYEFTHVAGPPTHQLIRTMRTEYYSISGDGGIEVTPAFIEQYRNKTLRISRRQDLPIIESYLTALVPALDSSNDISSLLTCWSTSSIGKLGLDFTMYDVEKGLKELNDPIQVLASGIDLKGKKLANSVRRARHFIGVALHEKLEKLEGPWSKTVGERWNHPIDVESNLAACLLEPMDTKAIYEAAKSFCNVVSRFADIIERLTILAPESSTQTDLFSAQKSGLQQTTEVLLNEASSLTAQLRTMRNEPPSMPHLPDGSLERRMAVGRHLKQSIDILRQFSSAFCWDYSPDSVDDDEPIDRVRVVLFADTKGSTVKGLTWEDQAYYEWKNNGLNLISQWGHAFGGKEISKIHPRHGDDICIEFSDQDSAILCASFVQEHVRALRATNSEKLSYVFRMAVDSYLVRDADGGNTISSAIDRASKLAKFEREVDINAGVFDRVWITPEATEGASESIRNAFLDRSTTEIDLGADVAKARFKPYFVNCTGLLEEHSRKFKQK